MWNLCLARPDVAGHPLEPLQELGDPRLPKQLDLYEAGDVLPVPGMGWFAVCKDVEGNEFGLWQTDSSASMPE